ncbi:hypothetical protein EDD29_2288 [Actinocorallia herbida]|uniref:Uncharacterized protein n=1 Tax=Actinocorallia herbida TaxID=58109 RepID=A0A3N1CTX1_9ACTN|nr:hypothetical protein [Actinocorallia herbida]ROO84760.1 hypothetical protein EDD29_2288 [Actinocorallia herbida]
MPLLVSVLGKVPESLPMAVMMPVSAILTAGALVLMARPRLGLGEPVGEPAR